MNRDIFISYSHCDNDAVNSIKKELEACGFTCWMDVDGGVKSGSRRFSKDIIDAIDGSKCMLFFLSSESQSSEWALKEIDYATSENRNVVLVRFNDDPLTKEFRFDFGRSDIIDWRVAPQREKLLKDLGRWLQRKPVAIESGTQPQSDKAEMPKKTGPGCAKGENAPSTLASIVSCPICGKKNHPTDTFRCLECNRDNLCLRHQDGETFRCKECAAKAKAAEEARIEKERAEAEARRRAEEVSSPPDLPDISDLLDWDEGDVDEESNLSRCQAASADPRIGHADSPQPHKAGDILPMTVNGVSFSLRWIPATATRAGFWMGETPVTQELWTAVMAREPRDTFLLDRDYNEREGLPVSGVSWNDCQAFLQKINSLSDVADSGLSFRLPEEMEWEFACRAGGKGTCCLLSDGREITKKTLDIVAWFGGNSGGMTHPVKRREPNAWGLYDMHGNVCEWIQATDDEYGLLCGGSWWDRPRDCASSSRDRDSLDRVDSRYGFRICADMAEEARCKATRDAESATLDEQIIRDQAESLYQKGEEIAKSGGSKAGKQSAAHGDSAAIDNFFDAFFGEADKRQVSLIRPVGRPRPDSSWPVVGRNDPCPCGSGKKYKHCHGAGL